MNISIGLSLPLGTRMAVLAGCAALAGCMSAPPAAAPGTSEAQVAAEWSGHAPHGPGGTPAWTHYLLPGKRATHYQYVHLDGRACVQASSSASASMLRTQLQIPGDALGTLRFSWKVPALVRDSDLRKRESDDAPARLMLAFEGDRSRLSARDAMLSELSRALTGEEMPYATLVYAWGRHSPPDTIVTHPRSERVKVVVVESGPARLDQWLHYERDVRADFERAFGEAPGRLVGVAIMTDSDNTGTTAHAWYGPVQVGTRTAQAAGDQAPSPGQR